MVHFTLIHFLFLHSLYQFQFHQHLNLQLIQDENLKIIIMLGNDVFDDLIKNHPSNPFIQLNKVNMKDKKVLELEPLSKISHIKNE